MEIFELAAQLGKELKKDERLVRMANAKEAYENDMDLRTLMREYQVQQIALEKTAGQKDVEARFLEMIQNRINELYDQIVAHPVYVELEQVTAARGGALGSNCRSTRVAMLPKFSDVNVYLKLSEICSPS